MGADDDERPTKRGRKRSRGGGKKKKRRERVDDDVETEGKGDGGAGAGQDDAEPKGEEEPPRQPSRPTAEEAQRNAADDGEEEEGGDDTPGKGDDGDEAEGDDDREHRPSTKRKRKRKRKRKAVDDKGEGSAGDGGGGGKDDEKLTSMEHTVYVEGIPFDCSEDDVRDFFAGHGCGDVLQMRLPRWQDSGRLRGYGHIVFNTKESRTKALKELNGLNLGRRYLTIREPNAPRPGTSAAAAAASSGGVEPRPQPEGCRTVFAKNLPYGASEDDVAEAFRPCGKIVDGGVRLARNYVSGQCKGFAYVEFKNPEGALAAVRRAARPFGLAVGGRPCFVDYDEGRMKGSYRTAEGRLWQKEHGSVHSTGGKQRR